VREKAITVMERHEPGPLPDTVRAEIQYILQ